jgi:hypothetical protein
VIELIFIVFNSVLKGLSVQLASKYLFKIKPKLKYLSLLIFSIFVVSYILILGFDFITSSNTTSRHDNGFIKIIIFLLTQIIFFAKYLQYPLGKSINGMGLLKLIGLSILIEALLYIPLALVLMVIFSFFGSNVS